MDIKNNYHCIFLILFVILIILSFLNYICQEYFISHFNEMSAKIVDSNLTTIYSIDGQFKTLGEGFYVGKEIEISFLFKLDNETDYEAVKNKLKGFKKTIIEGSENPEYAKMDISNSLKIGDRPNASEYPGTIALVSFFDDKKSIYFNGSVVFTREGKLEFGLPLSFILKEYGLDLEGINIAPAYVKYQVESNRIMRSLALLTASIACLSLFFSIHLKKNKKNEDNKNHS